jgi:hypothetical protein
MRQLHSAGSGRLRLAARATRLRGGAILLVAVGATALTACGGGSGSPATSTTTSGGAAATTTATGGGAGANAAFAKYQSCMKQHGVTFRGFGDRAPGAGGAGSAPPSTPPGTTGGSGGGAPPQGFDNATFQKAQKACASLRPKGFRGRRPGGFGGGQNDPAFAAYRNCLTIHGVKLTDLRPGNAGATPSAKVRKALTSCASLRPARGAPSTSTTTTPAQ